MSLLSEQVRAEITQIAEVVARRIQAESAIEPVQPEQAMGKAAFARRVGISISTLERRLQNDQIDHCRDGVRVIFFEKHVAAFIESREVKARSRASSPISAIRDRDE